MTIAYLKSRDPDGLHSESAEGKVQILSWITSVQLIVKTDEGTICHANFNPFVGKIFADDVYGIISSEEAEHYV